MVLLGTRKNIFNEPKIIFFSGVVIIAGLRDALGLAIVLSRIEIEAVIIFKLIYVKSNKVLELVGIVKRGAFFLYWSFKKVTYTALGVAVGLIVPHSHIVVVIFVVQ